MANDRKLNVGLVTTVSGRWPRELPERRHCTSAEWITETFSEVALTVAEGICVDPQQTEKAVELMAKAQVDLVIVQLGAFSGDIACVEIAEKLRVPMVVWAQREPPFDGGRLMSNALVAATMNNAALKRLGHKTQFVYGNLKEQRVQNELRQTVRIHHTLKRLKNTFLGLVGYRPTGFYSSTFDETLIRRLFGVRVEEVDLVEALDRAENMDDETVRGDMDTLKKSACLKDLPEEHLENHSRLYLALKSIIDEQKFDALSLKCWPELGNRKFTPCAAIARFADAGFVIGCENDVNATITMLAQKFLSRNRTPWMCDLIDVDEKTNTVLFWHCGQAACKLLSEEKPDLMDHSLAGRGAVFEGTLRPGTATVARFTIFDNRYKLFLARGQSIETEREVHGVMTRMKMDEPVLDMIYRIADSGVPHHYSIVWEEQTEDLMEMCRLLDIEVLSG